MKFAKLALKAYGPFTGKVLDFERAPAGLQIVYGPNEAGKSTALRAIDALVFGIPGQTPDAFLHDYGSLRIGAVLLTDDDRRLAVMRRKGAKATLFPFDEQSGQELTQTPLPPDFIARLLGNLDQNTFRTLFGIDHRRLREGGRELLEGHGEVGQSLFQAASGLAGVRRLLKQLDEEAAALFAPRATNPSINAAIRKFGEAKQAQRDALVRPKIWKDLEAALTHAESSAQAIQDELTALRAEEKLLTRLQATIPAIVERGELLDELAALKTAPLLSEDAAQRRIEAQTRLQGADAATAEASALIAGYEKELGGLAIPETLLTRGPEIEALRHDGQRVGNAAETVLRASTLLSAAQREICERIARIAPRTLADQARGILPERTVFARVRTLSTRLSEAAAETDSVTRLKAELERDLADAQADLESLPRAPDLSALAATVETLTGQGVLEAQVDKVDAEVKVIAGQLIAEANTLGVPEAASLRALAIPQEAEVDAFAADLRQYQEALARLDKEIDALKRDIEALRAALSGLEAAGDVVNADKVMAARRHRDHGWRLIRTAYIERSADPAELALQYGGSSDLPEAFEQAVRRADNLADNLRADIQRATEYASQRKRVEQMQVRMAELERDRGERGEAAKRSREQWLSLIARLGLRAMAPETFKGWLAERKRVLQLQEQHDRLVAQRDAACATVVRARTSLVTTLRAAGLAEPDASISLAVALRHAAKSVADANKAGDNIARRREEVNRLRREIGRCGSKLRDAVATETRLRKDWQEAVGLLHMPAATTPEEAEARIEDLSRLREILDESDRLRSQMDGEQSFLDDYRARVGRLATALGVGVPLPEEIRGFVEKHYAELLATRKRAQRRDNLDESLQRERERLAKAESARQSENKVLEDLMAAAGCEDLALLPEAEERSKQRRKAESRLQEIESQLVRQWKNPLDALLSEAAGTTVETVEERLAQVQERLGVLETRLLDAQRAVAKARQDFEGIDGAAKAAEAREDAESLLARIRHDAEGYASLRLARALLSQAIRAYQEKAQGPLLARAGHYFSLMTGGRYPKLQVDFEDDAQVIVAEQVSGAGIHVSGMSEGTADQLYLALRLAAIELQLDNGTAVPVILDDVLMAFDDERAVFALQALAALARRTQVLVFTHHRHVVEIAQGCLTGDQVGFVGLNEDQAG